MRKIKNIDMDIDLLRNKFKRNTFFLVSSLMIGSVIASCGATKKTETAEETAEEEKCEHLIVDFGDESVVFKECEGYDVQVGYDSYSGRLVYNIYDNDKNNIFNGATFSYNHYYASHDYISEVEDDDIKVFKLKNNSCSNSVRENNK